MSHGETVGVAGADGVKALTEALSAPFDPSEVKWKPQSVKGNRALAMGYVDARVVQDRLDDVLGVENWQDKYQFLPDGSVVCELTLKLGDRWITKVDVGGQSEQPDGGDRVKAAVSDALKRAAVKFGVGRYLYRLPAQWADYDPVKKQFVQPPKLPAFALPRPVTHTRELPPSPPPPAALPAGKSGPVAAPPPALPLKDQAPAKATLPKDWQEFHASLSDMNAKLVAEGVLADGRLLQHVVRTVNTKERKVGTEVHKWPPDLIPEACQAARKLILDVRGAAKKPTAAATNADSQPVPGDDPRWAAVDRFAASRKLDGRNAVIRFAWPLLGKKGEPPIATAIDSDQLTDLEQWTAEAAPAA